MDPDVTIDESGAAALEALRIQERTQHMKKKLHEKFGDDECLRQTGFDLQDTVPTQFVYITTLAQCNDFFKKKTNSSRSIVGYDQERVHHENGKASIVIHSFCWMKIKGVEPDETENNLVEKDGMLMTIALVAGDSLSSVAIKHMNIVNLTGSGIRNDMDYLKSESLKPNLVDSLRLIGMNLKGFMNHCGDPAPNLHWSWFKCDEFGKKPGWRAYLEYCIMDVIASKYAFHCLNAQKKCNIGSYRKIVREEISSCKDSELFMDHIVQMGKPMNSVSRDPIDDSPKKFDKILRTLPPMMNEGSDAWKWSIEIHEKLAAKKPICCACGSEDHTIRSCPDYGKEYQSLNSTSYSNELLYDIFYTHPVTRSRMLELDISDPSMVCGIPKEERITMLFVADIHSETKLFELLKKRNICIEKEDCMRETAEEVLAYVNDHKSLDMKIHRSENGFSFIFRNKDTGDLFTTDVKTQSPKLASAYLVRGYAHLNRTGLSKGLLTGDFASCTSIRNLVRSNSRPEELLTKRLFLDDEQRLLSYVEMNKDLLDSDEKETLETLEDQLACTYTPIPHFNDKPRDSLGIPRSTNISHLRPAKLDKDMESGASTTIGDMYLEEVLGPSEGSKDHARAYELAQTELPPALFTLAPTEAKLALRAVHADSKKKVLNFHTGESRTKLELNKPFYDRISEWLSAKVQYTYDRLTLSHEDWKVKYDRKTDMAMPSILHRLQSTCNVCSSPKISCRCIVCSHCRQTKIGCRCEKPFFF
jgi:hypothetical protein